MNHANFDQSNLDRRDMIFWFHEEEINVPESSHDSTVDEEENNGGDERKAFWELQEQLLHTALYRTTSFEAKVRQAAKDALTELRSAGARCSCRLAEAAVSCRRCGMNEMSIMLQKAGFDCVVCMSKWKSSSEIPAAGQHTYLEVVQSADSKKGGMKVIVELDLRAEFEMARSSQEYNQLVAKLPQIFVGKVERLRNLVNILCGACKKCMKERRMHVAPWRKYKYMQAKWQGKPMLQAAPPHLVVEPSLSRQEKRTSLLSFDVEDTLHHSKAITVI